MTSCLNSRLVYPAASIWMADMHFKAYISQTELLLFLLQPSVSPSLLHFKIEHHWPLTCWSKNLRVTHDSFLFLKPHKILIVKSFVISTLKHMLDLSISMSTTVSLVQTTTTVSPFHYFRSFLTGLPVAAHGSCFHFFSNTIFYLQNSHNYFLNKNINQIMLLPHPDTFSGFPLIYIQCLWFGPYLP